GVATQDSRGAIEALADDMQLTFPIVIDGDNSVTRAYRVIGPPYTFFIDANGVVMDVIPGALKQDRLDQLLDKLINTASADAAGERGISADLNVPLVRRAESYRDRSGSKPSPGIRRARPGIGWAP
ncbi:MAG: redoxin domain-containing protein, partial [Gammaproteobacteria bacterium]